MALSQQIGFLIERATDAPHGRSSDDHRVSHRVSQTADPGGHLPWAPLQAGGVYALTWRPQSAPTIRPLETAGLSKGKRTKSVLLQVVRHQFDLYIALMSEPSCELRLNGLPPGPVSILKLKDQLQLDPHCCLHVSLFRRPYVGPPCETEENTECQICRTPLRAGQTIYRCASCGLAMHHGAPENGPQDRLECAVASSACPRCRLHLVRKEGYAYFPEI